MTRAIAVAGALVLAFALPAHAHTEDQLTRWLDHHSRQQADVSLMRPADQKIWNQVLDAERADWERRHPCSKVLETWTESACVRPVVHSHSASDSGSSGSSGSSVNRGMGSNVEQWRGLVEAYFAPDKVNMAMCIMAGESGGNPNAKNRNSSAAGLFQFLKSTWDNMVPSSVTGGSYNSGQVYDPEANIRAAAWLQSAAGWSQWSVYNRGRC